MTKLLVVVDMQKDFTTGPLGNAECTAVIDKVVAEIESHKYDDVIFTMDTHHSDYLNTQEGLNLPVKHCIEGTEGWEIEPVILNAAKKAFKKCEIFSKNTFGSRKMAEWLSQKYGNGEHVQITFVGVCTGICVINNVSVVKAFLPEAKIEVIADACACVTPESHKTALEAMKLFQVNVIE